MSRSGYYEDCDDDLAAGRWQGQLKSAIRGKRGQAFLRELVEALELMPVKALAADVLRKDGEMCALGALGAHRGIDLEALNPEDADAIADAFNVAPQLVREIEYLNDDDFAFRNDETPEERWVRMHKWAKAKIATNAVLSGITYG